MNIEDRQDLIVVRSALLRHTKQRRRDTARLKGRRGREADVYHNEREVARGERMLEEINVELRRGK